MNKFNKANQKVLSSNTNELLAGAYTSGFYAAIVKVCTIAANLVVTGENFITEKQFYAIYHGLHFAEVEALDNFKAQAGYEAAKKARQRSVNPLVKSKEHWSKQVDFSVIDFSDPQAVVTTALANFSWLNEARTFTAMSAYLVGFAPTVEKPNKPTVSDKKGTDDTLEANEQAGEQVLKAVADATNGLANKVEILLESARLDVLGKRPTKKQIEAFDKAMAMTASLINQASL